MGDSYLDDDGGAEVVAVEEAAQPGALWVRVGPVWEGEQVRGEPGVWVDYQKIHLQSPLSGVLLFTPAVWRQLAAAVEARLTEREKPGDG